MAKEGALIIDHKYDADGFGALHDRIETMSAGKTITAALTGAAVQQGLFSIDVPLVKYGVSDALANWNRSGVDYFPNLTARHLLTQTSGAGLVPPGSALTYDSDVYVQRLVTGGGGIQYKFVLLVQVNQNIFFLGISSLPFASM